MHPRLSDNAVQLSYAAGSTSLDPYGFRVVDTSSMHRFAELARTFSGLGQLLEQNALLVSAYPATLGLAGVMTFVDTYLHPPHFFRSLRLAAKEGWPVVMVAQPLAGAHLLLQHLERDLELPQQILWAVGGYYLPLSLERFIVKHLSDRGCTVNFLYCYGIAEVGHTCFAAIRRGPEDLPLYKLVARDVQVCVPPDTGKLLLQRHDSHVLVDTGDFASPVGEYWQINNGEQRLSSEIRSRLENWTADDWLRRTGYLSIADQKFVFQTRACRPSPSADELGFHRFLETFGGSWTMKPDWAGQERSREAGTSSPSGATQCV